MTVARHQNQMRRSDQNWPESPRLAPFGGGNTHDFEKIRWGDGLVCLCSSYGYAFKASGWKTGSTSYEIYRLQQHSNKQWAVDLWVWVGRATIPLYLYQIPASKITEMWYFFYCTVPEIWYFFFLCNSCSALFFVTSAVPGMWFPLDVLFSFSVSLSLCYLHCLVILLYFDLFLRIKVAPPSMQNPHMGLYCLLSLINRSFIWFTNNVLFCFFCFSDIFRKTKLAPRVCQRNSPMS